MANGSVGPFTVDYARSQALTVAMASRRYKTVFIVGVQVGLDFIDRASRLVPANSSPAVVLAIADEVEKEQKELDQKWAAYRELIERDRKLADGLRKSKLFRKFQYDAQVALPKTNLIFDVYTKHRSRMDFHPDSMAVMSCWVAHVKNQRFDRSVHYINNPDGSYTPSLGEWCVGYSWWADGLIPTDPGGIAYGYAYGDTLGAAMDEAALKGWLDDPREVPPKRVKYGLM